MAQYTWTVDFLRVYEKAADPYRAGERKRDALFDPADLPFLDSIGATPQELFDEVEDAVSDEVPDFATTLLVAAARRDYFLVVQKGKPSGKRRRLDDFPKKSDSVAGIEWLPRLIEKARAKLRGELPVDLMYGCGGDRKFLSAHDIHPADFLRTVWSAGEETARIVAYVQGKTV
jgi:hypothetical protein